MSTLKRFAASLFVLGALLPLAAPAQDTTEKVEVNLALIDALVLDKKGRTVPGLTREDFELIVRGKSVEIDTFDASCPAGESDEPVELEQGQTREPIAPEQTRRTVILIDYYHLSHPDRSVVLKFAAAGVHDHKLDNEEIMVTALHNGLRIEQRFTRNKQEILDTLVRMEHDVTLWAVESSSPTGKSFFKNLSTLMDVLAAYDGSKAVVMYSMMVARSDDYDLWFADVAERAATARTAIYPVWAGGVEGPIAGSPALVRLATESGGRLTHRTNDLSLGYARAQRDLACRYTLGFYVDPEYTRKAQRIKIHVKGSGREVRAPEAFRLWTEEQRKTSRLRAAFVDPSPYEHPLVRAFVFPLKPASKKAWESLVSLSFPLAVEEEDVSIEVGAILTKTVNGTVIEKFKGSSTIKASPGGPDQRKVTLYGESRLKPGSYTLNAVLTKPDQNDIFTASTVITVPDVPEGLVVRGPVLALVTPGGVLIRGDREEPGSAVRELIGDDAGFEPLLVNQLNQDASFLVAWTVCLTTGKVPAGASIRRRVVAGGEIRHELEPIPLEFPRKQKLPCIEHVDRLDASDLGPGSHRLDVMVLGADGEEVLAVGVAPVSVH